jgi:hypothetical protein
MTENPKGKRTQENWTENQKRKTPQMLQLLEEHSPEKPRDPTIMAVTSTQLLTRRKSHKQ